MCYNVDVYKIGHIKSSDTELVKKYLDDDKSYKAKILGGPFKELDYDEIVEVNGQFKMEIHFRLGGYYMSVQNVTASGVTTLGMKANVKKSLVCTYRFARNLQSLLLLTYLIGKSFSYER